MSTATPAASTPGEAASPAATATAPTTAEPPNSFSAIDRVVLDYLRNRGYGEAEKLVRESLEGASPADTTPTASGSNTISAEDFAKKAAVYAQDAKRPGENAFKDSTTVLQELGTMGNPPNIQNLIASIGPVGAEEVLSLDPTDKQEGFRELEAWVDGSLDMYRVSVRPVAQTRRAVLTNLTSLSSGPYCFLYSATFTLT